MYRTHAFHKWSILQLMAGAQMLVLASLIAYGSYNKLNKTEDLIFVGLFLLIFLPLVYYFLKTPLKVSLEENELNIIQPFVFKKQSHNFKDIFGYSYGITQTKYYELHTVVLYFKNGQVLEVTNRMIDKYEHFLEQLTACDEIEYLGFERSPFCYNEMSRNYSYSKLQFNQPDYDTKKYKKELINASNGFATGITSLAILMLLTISISYFFI